MRGVIEVPRAAEQNDGMSNSLFSHDSILFFAALELLVFICQAEFISHIIMRILLLLPFLTQGFQLSPKFGVPARHSSALFISSFSPSAPVENRNPAENVVGYLQEPQAVEARSSIDETCLVSGLVKSQERTDQFIFDLLNNEESAFEFRKIIAFVNDQAFAKKRLLSRSARYTGLLDKLDFMEASSPNALPTVEQLQGVKSWVAYVDPEQGGDSAIDQIKAIANTAQSVNSLVNLAILVVEGSELDVSKSNEALEALKQSNKVYTLVVVGKVEDRPEGKEFYQFKEFGTEEAVLPAKSTFSREESLRMITELLQLEAGANKALAFAEVYNANKTEAKLIRGLRQAGYARPQEIDHMLRDGVEKYQKACQDYLEENPDAAKGYTTNAWWEKEEFQKSRQRSAERDQEKVEAMKSEREKEIEAVAREWAKREFYQQSMSGSVGVDTTEEEFIKSVWDRAMFEGDLKWRKMNGEIMDEATELADFKSRQERKKQAMLKRAKEELANILDEEGLDGDELRARFEEQENIPKDKDDEKQY